MLTALKVESSNHIHAAMLGHIYASTTACSLYLSILLFSICTPGLHVKGSRAVLCRDRGEWGNSARPRGSC